jgi:hypothetical protein
VTAQRTAQRVLAWAHEPKGPLPTGSVDESRALADPDSDTRELLVSLTRDTAARLGAGWLPFGDATPVGLGAVFLAAAAGARVQPVVAERLLRAAPPVPGHRVADAVARHGVLRNLVPAPPESGPRSRPAAGPQRAELAAALWEAALDVSPLTALLYRPPTDRLSSGATGRETDLARRLLASRHGRACLVRALSTAMPEAAVLAWRLRLLATLRHEDRDFVLDLYLTARVRHGAQWDKLIDSAADQLAAEELPPPGPVNVARFWSPLAAIRRAQPGLLQELPYLEGSERALDLVRKYRLTEAV